MKATLNASQKQAVQYTAGHLLIVAGPGTGKTYTLTHRMAHIAPTLSGGQKILAITFTNKAAIEMKQRLDTFWKEDTDIYLVGTFHQLCWQILRQYRDLIHLPEDFRVASQQQSEAIAGSKELLFKISRWKAVDFDGPVPQDVLDYNAKLRAARQLDFDDLILETLRLLGENPKVACEIRTSYPYIFVDEYQDINRSQHALLQLLVGSTGHITAIGDPNQAIYGFRGADNRYFNTFSQDFPGARVLFLSDNYRSAANLLSASGQVIAAGSLRVPTLTANIYTQGRLITHQAPTEKAEAEYVVHQIEKIVGGTSLFSQDSGRVASHQQAEQSFGDIAILYRLNSQRFALQKALDRSGMPYQVVGIKKDKISGNVIDDLYNVMDDDGEIYAEKITLMTIHASKGLEFPTVFMVGCEENIIPLNIAGFTADKEEERRLFYVGMTRARYYLFCVSAKQRYLYGKLYKNQLSSFLLDIEAKLKESAEMKSRPRKRKKDDGQMTLF